MKTAVYARFFVWGNFQRQNDVVESVAESVAGDAVESVAEDAVESVAEDAVESVEKGVAKDVVELGAKRDFIQKF